MCGIEEEMDFSNEICELIREAKYGNKHYAKEWILKLKAFNRICIFGAGEHGKNWLHILKMYDVKVDCFIDNDKSYWEKNITSNIFCYSPQVLNEQKDKTAVLIAIRDYCSVKHQLIKIGCYNIFIGTLNKISFITNFEYVGDIEKLNILQDGVLNILNICEDYTSKLLCYQTVRKWLTDENFEIPYHGEAYFIPELRKNEDEIFVDGGAYDGDTIKSYLKHYRNKTKAIHAFELDQRNYYKLKKEIELLPIDIKEKIFLYNMGLSNKKECIEYNSNFQTSEIVKDGELVGNTDCLDNILKECSFMKMDIEGSELNALDGAREIIQKHKPKLAISIYHSAADFWEIPLLIKKLNPNYRILLRHHSYEDNETICYAL